MTVTVEQEVAPLVVGEEVHHPVIEEKDHIGLVYKVAYDLANNSDFCRAKLGTDVGEYIGYGYIGLRHAIKNYRPEKGEWANYAWTVIKDTIVKHARRASTVKIADGARYQAWRVMNGKEKSNRITEKSVNAARTWLERQTVSIHSSTERELQVGAKDPTPQWENEEAVNAAFKCLTKRQAFVVKCRFGFFEEPMTLEEIGELLGVTKERVRQIQEEAMERMRSRVA